MRASSDWPYGSREIRGDIARLPVVADVHVAYPSIRSDDDRPQRVIDLAGRDVDRQAEVPGDGLDLRLGPGGELPVGRRRAVGVGQVGGAVCLQYIRSVVFWIDGDAEELRLPSQV